MILMLAALVMAPRQAEARYQSTDCDCEDNSSACGSVSIGGASVNVGRIVQFYDAGGHQYYTYLVLCDGRVLDQWQGDLHPIGEVPVWAFPFVMTELVELSNGDIQMEIFSAGYPALTITYDQVPGHRAAVTTYDSPLQ